MLRTAHLVLGHQACGLHSGIDGSIVRGLAVILLALGGRSRVLVLRARPLDVGHGRVVELLVAIVLARMVVVVLGHGRWIPDRRKLNPPVSPPDGRAAIRPLG